MATRYTGKERDTESGLDYFGARYYASNMGRFLSPDPSGLAYADPTNPQSLNLYSYVLNNPVGFVDPDGLECVWDDGSFDSKDDAVTGSQAGCEGQGGQYINPVAFGTLGLGDWSGQASSYVSFVANALGAQTNVTNVQVNADGSGSVQQSYTNVSDGLQYQMQNNFSWAGDPSLELATAVMSQGIPKVCAVGVNLSLRKYSANVSVSGNGVGATAGDHSVGTSAPQNTGTGKNTVPIGGPNGTVPFSVYHNSKGVMNGITSVSADLKVKKVGVSPYINVGTYTPNLSDPQNCP